jgi:hypothetical protein
MFTFYRVQKASRIQLKVFSEKNFVSASTSMVKKALLAGAGN